MGTYTGEQALYKDSGQLWKTTGQQFNDPYFQVASDYNVTPGSQQHLALLEQDYPNYVGSKVAWDPNMVRDQVVDPDGIVTSELKGGWTTDPNKLAPEGTFSFDPETSFYSPEVRAMQSAAFSSSTTPTYMAADTSLLGKSKTAMDAISKGYQAWTSMQGTPSGGGTAPSWVTSVPAGDTLLGKQEGVGGSAGTGIFSQQTEQYQPGMIAAIKQQEELARRRAQVGWSAAYWQT